MTYEQFFALGGFVLAVLGAVGYWLRHIEQKIDKTIKTSIESVDQRAVTAAALAELTRQQLADHKLHVAETYITKAGHRETTDQLMGMLREMTGDIRALRERFDQWMDRA